MSKKTKKTFTNMSDLTTGVCWRCGEYSDKIVRSDGRCVYCFDEEDELDDNKVDYDY